MKLLACLLALCAAAFLPASDSIGLGPVPTVTNSTLASPGPIGSTVANTGAFTTLAATGLTVTESATGTVSWSDSATTTQPYALTLDHASSGTPASGFGTSLVMTAKSATVANRKQFEILNSWNTATDASRTDITQFRVYDTAAREFMQAQSDGAAARIGFLGTTAVAQQANTVDADTALVNYGLKASGGPRGRRIWSVVQTGITLNSANTDVATITGLPAKWRAAQFIVWEASTSLTTATVQLMTAAAGAGTNVFTSTPASLTSATAATAVVAPGITTNQYFTPSTLYFRNVTAQGAPATVSISFEYIDLTP